MYLFLLEETVENNFFSLSDLTFKEIQTAEESSWILIEIFSMFLLTNASFFT
jgi:hypothetical protein